MRPVPEQPALARQATGPQYRTPKFVAPPNRANAEARPASPRKLGDENAGPISTPFSWVSLKLSPGTYGLTSLTATTSAIPIGDRFRC